jgi:hypothetical protein
VPAQAVFVAQPISAINKSAPTRAAFDAHVNRTVD